MWPALAVLVPLTLVVVGVYVIARDAFCHRRATRTVAATIVEIRVDMNRHLGGTRTPYYTPIGTYIIDQPIGVAATSAFAPNAVKIKQAKKAAIHPMRPIELILADHHDRPLLGMVLMAAGVLGCVLALVIA